MNRAPSAMKNIVRAREMCGSFVVLSCFLSKYIDDVNRIFRKKIKNYSSRVEFAASSPLNFNRVVHILIILAVIPLIVEIDVNNVRVVLPYGTRV